MELAEAIKLWDRNKLEAMFLQLSASNTAMSDSHIELETRVEEQSALIGFLQKENASLQQSKKDNTL